MVLRSRHHCAIQSPHASGEDGTVAREVPSPKTAATAGISLPKFSEVNCPELLTTASASHELAKIHGKRFFCDSLVITLSQSDCIISVQPEPLPGHRSIQPENRLALKS